MTHIELLNDPPGLIPVARCPRIYLTTSRAGDSNCHVWQSTRREPLGRSGRKYTPRPPCSEPILNIDNSQKRNTRVRPCDQDPTLARVRVTHINGGLVIAVLRHDGGHTRVPDHRRSLPGDGPQLGRCFAMAESQSRHCPVFAHRCFDRSEQRPQHHPRCVPDRPGTGKV